MKTRILIAAVAIALASAFTVVITPGEAFAANCTALPNTNHCYAEDYYNGTESAAGTDLEVDCLSVANRSTDFASYEMWVLTNTPQVSYDTWVEIGMIAGFLQNGQTGFMWFWGQMRPDGQFHDYYISGASTGNLTNASAYYEGNDNWNLYKGGHLVGTSTANGNGGIETISGTEVTTTAMTVVGQSGNYQFRDSAGWHWVPDDNYISPNAGGLFTTFPSTGYYGVSTGCNGDTAPHKFTAAPAAPIPASPAGAARALAKIAHGAAVANHNPGPARIEYVKTTRQRAARVLSGARVNSNQPAYVVMLRGHFTAPVPPHAKKAAPPAANTMELTVDAATGQITDWGIGPARTFHLSRLGPVHTAP
jgi:hypothetical protein